MEVVTVAAVWSSNPAQIEGRAALLRNTETVTTIEIDTCNYVFLTLEQTRSLWHELGAVLQSLDHDAEAEAPAEIVSTEPSTLDFTERECVNCRRPICWSPLTGDWYHVLDLCVNCVGSSDEWPRVATPVMAISKSASIRNLEDLRGLPHSSDLESHPSNPRR